MKPVLDFLRVNFACFVAVALPPSGLILAIIRYSSGDREDGLRIAACAALGGCLYALLLT
jgi:threonine/homoserine/homoserine lactone efflux protein